MGEDVISTLAKEFKLEIAQNLVFPKLYSCPSGVYRDLEKGMVFGMGDKASPVAGAAAQAEFVLETMPGAKTTTVRA